MASRSSTQSALTFVSTDMVIKVIALAWRFILRPFPRRFSFKVVLGVLGVLSCF